MKMLVGNPGQRLPSELELIKGFPFLCDDIKVDIMMFSRQMVRLSAKIDGSIGAHLYTMAEEMAAPNAGDFERLAQAFEEVRKRKSAAGEDPVLTAAAARCHFYAAVSGDATSALKVAKFAVAAVYSPMPAYAVLAQVVGTVAWLLVATGKRQLPKEWNRR